jgi:DNA-binding transcriptional LysR family regulator
MGNDEVLIWRQLGGGGMRTVMQDLNDIHYFVQVVEHGTFSAASKTLGIAKSQLSFRIARLEESLGARLIQRTTRHFHVTALGKRYYEQCLQILAAVNQAQKLVDDVQGKPQGRIRVGCPVSFDHLLLAPIIIGYLKHNPGVHIDLDTCHHQMDIVEAGYDIAFRVRPSLKDSSMVVRSFGLDPQILVASPDLLKQLGEPKSPDDLRRFPSVDTISNEGRHFWCLQKAKDAPIQMEHHPNLITDNLQVLFQGIHAGVGVSQCPEFVCRPYLARGELVRVLPHWSLPPGNVHAVYPSRHGQIPALRDFIDYTAQHMPKLLEKLHRDSDSPTTHQL